MPSGEPEGLRIIEKSNWTGLGLSFPRSVYPQIRGREEITRAGVYILWGPSDGGQLPRAYVGEGDSLIDRLDSHIKSKDFWTHGIAFTSKDQNLNKAHIRYLESRLIVLANEAKRCELENGNTPQTPSLSGADTADAELYLSDMLLCLPILGLNHFEKPSMQEHTSQELFLSSQNISAKGYEDLGGFVVKEGSKAAKDEAHSLQGHISNLRTTLVSKGILVDEGSAFRLVQDYAFSSPSNASSVILGRSSNGRQEWKDANGRTLKSLQEAKVNSS